MGAASYNLKRATVNGGPYTAVTNVTTTNCTNTGLTNGTNYYYVVSALNAGGESANSSEVSATPKNRPPVLVNGSDPALPTLDAASITNGRFGFWIAGDAGPDYTIQASTDLVSWSSVDTSMSPAVPFFWADTNSTPFSSRFYRALLGP